jgi:hypothetical protein
MVAACNIYRTVECGRVPGRTSQYSLQLQSCKVYARGNEELHILIVISIILSLSIYVRISRYRHVWLVDFYYYQTESLLYFGQLATNHVYLETIRYTHTPTPTYIWPSLSQISQNTHLFNPVAPAPAFDNYYSGQMAKHR